MTNPRHPESRERADTPRKDEPLVVALRWDPEVNTAPDVVGKGRGAVAERILELARAEGVPVREDADLLELLAGLDLGEEIPPELYEVVAELLTFLHRVNESMRA